MATTVPMPEMVGTFRVLEQLGSGSFYEVYLAEDTDPKYQGDKVTVKRVRPELFRRDPLFRAAIIAEGELGRRITHPGVVQIYDLLEVDGTPFLVSEFVDGITLDELQAVAKGPIDPAIAAEMARQICEGLYAIHEAMDEAGEPLHLVHQSVTPTNICINKRGDLKLLESGIARSKMMGAGLSELKGNDAYLSPEQHAGESLLTPASDQYSVGVIVFELLSGIPFLSGLEALAAIAENHFKEKAANRADEDAVVVELDGIFGDTEESDSSFDEPPPKERKARQAWSRRQMPSHLHTLDKLPGAGLDEILGPMMAFGPEERYESTHQAGEELLRWAWGMTGQGTDFRGFVETIIARVQGGSVASSSHVALDGGVLKPAMDSSFLPPSLAPIADSAFLPPSLDKASEPELADAAHTPGALMDVEVGTPDMEEEDEADSPEDEFKVKTDPGVNLAAMEKGNIGTQPPAQHLMSKISSKSDESAAKPKRNPLIPIYLAAVGVFLIAAVGLYFSSSSELNEGLASKQGATPAAVALEATPENSGLAKMLQQTAENTSFRGLRTADGKMTDLAPRPTDDKHQPLAALVGDMDTGGKPLPPERPKPFLGKREDGTAFLTVHSSPPGTTVILDGLDIEETPVTFDSISAGEHQLILRSEDLGIRHVRLLTLKSGEHWKGSYNFHEKKWVDEKN